jgi:CheY-like chemotaxis protein
LAVDPFAPAAPPAAVGHVPAAADAPVRTVLCVEDNPANLKLVESVLARRADIQLIGAKDGRSGIDLARSTQPDVILMDINLPGMSGITAMRILAGEADTAHIPVVALSANAMPRDVEKGIEAGFFHYLTKPIKLQEFLETLDLALLHASANPGPQRARKPEVSR